MNRNSFFSKQKYELNKNKSMSSNYGLFPQLYENIPYLYIIFEDQPLPSLLLLPLLHST